MDRLLAALSVILLAGCLQEGEAPPGARAPGGDSKSDDGTELGDADGGNPSDGAGDGGDARWIGVEIDYVGFQRFIPGAREIVTDSFAAIGYRVELEDSEELEPVDVLDYGMQSPMLQDYYLEHFDRRGEAGWHYMLMGDRLANSNRGWGMLGGDLFVISADPLVTYPEHQAEAQANIILHELGHNLGLRHEGFEPETSAGTHSKATCATADRSPSPEVPVTAYSPVCVEHIQLDSAPFVAAE